MESKVNRYREQWNNHVEDNFESIMPITLYRVTWKNVQGEFFEFWSDDKKVVSKKKYEIDHSEDSLIYINFESWFAYRSIEHDKKFGRIERERGWWELE